MGETSEYTIEVHADLPDKITKLAQKRGISERQVLQEALALARRIQRQPEEPPE